MKINNEEFFNTYAESYRRVIHNQKFIQESPLNTLLSSLLNGRVLDIGNGGIVDYTPLEAISLYSVDSSLRMLEMGDSITSDRRICGDAKNLPIKDNCFDRVLCKYLLHHLVKNTLEETEYYQRECLKQIYQILSKNGKILIVENCVSDYIEWLEVTTFRIYQSVFGWFNLPEVKFFSLKTLSALIESSGFIHLRVHKINLKLGWDMVPFITSHPWFKIPSKFYPFEVVLIEAQKKM